MIVVQDLPPDPLCLPWRTGGHPGVAVLALVGDLPSRRYMLVGMMASPEIAAEVCEAHNASLSVYPGAGDANRAIRARLAAVEYEDSPAPRTA